jgi:hypothetical protein
MAGSSIVAHRQLWHFPARTYSYSDAETHTYA